mmetsp:Transcript_14056/g.38627  ORF Transcript_14056/g.38627 Transcript_14056/m.38627 type:complete len:101 (-) Transcript_14056:1269-1571(-)
MTRKGYVHGTTSHRYAVRCSVPTDRLTTSGNANRNNEMRAQATLLGFTHWCPIDESTTTITTEECSTSRKHSTNGQQHYNDIYRALALCEDSPGLGASVS